jgi:FixJ family two-component response regulator
VPGYVDDALVHHGVLNDEADFLQKPFDAAGLTAKVQEALNRRSWLTSRRAAHEVSASKPPPRQ